MAVAEGRWGIERRSSGFPWRSLTVHTSESCRALRLDHEEVGGSPGNQNRFDFLQRNHPHSLSGWHVTFYNESKVWFTLKGKEMKNKTKQNPNSRAQYRNEARRQNFPQKISAPRYLGWFSLYVILMAQSGSENFKCVCYGREESCDPKQRQLGSRLAQWEKET